LFECACPVGYTGFTCETNINDCGTNNNDNPCGDFKEPRGTCSDGIASFTCACTTNSGPTCQLDEHACFSNPCEPYGTCTEPSEGEYECSCPVGAKSGVHGYSEIAGNTYYGFPTSAYCNKAKKDCDSNPCGHGTCLEFEEIQGDNECGEGFEQIQCRLENKCVKLLSVNDRVTFYRSKSVFLHYDDAKDFCESLALDSKLAQFKSEAELMSVVNEYQANGMDWKLEPEWVVVRYARISNAMQLYYRGMGVIQSIRSEHGHGNKMMYEDGSEFLSYSAADEIASRYDKISTKNVVIFNDGKLKGGSEGYYKNAICEVPIGSTSQHKTDFHVCKQLNQKLNFFRCICDSGYDGATCATAIDNCANFPCKHGGACENNPVTQSVTCTCSSGWTGEFCDADVDECASNPCGLYGDCSQSEGYGSFNCACHQGWEGQVCQESVNECLNQPCAGKGYCTSGLNSYTCDCFPSYSGTNCQDQNICELIACQNQATCSITNSAWDWQCVCPNGYAGDYCEIDINDCAGVICQNGGTCQDGLDSYSCTCRSGFNGHYCHNNIDDCAVNSCSVLSTERCNDQINDYECVCKNGYAGDFCNSEILECLSEPCQNGGICQEGGGDSGGEIGDFVCDCFGAFNGTVCEIEIYPCESSPCHAEGTEKCVNFGLKYDCVCKNNFDGDNCEVSTKDFVIGGIVLPSSLVSGLGKASGFVIIGLIFVVLLVKACRNHENAEKRKVETSEMLKSGFKGGEVELRKSVRKSLLRESKFKNDENVDHRITESRLSYSKRQSYLKSRPSKSKHSKTRQSESRQSESKQSESRQSKSRHSESKQETIQNQTKNGRKSINNPQIISRNIQNHRKNSKLKYTPSSDEHKYDEFHETLHDLGRESAKESVQIISDTYKKKQNLPNTTLKTVLPTVIENKNKDLASVKSLRSKSNKAEATKKEPEISQTKTNKKESIDSIKTTESPKVTESYRSVKSSGSKKSTKKSTESIKSRSNMKSLNQEEPIFRLSNTDFPIIQEPTSHQEKAFKTETTNPETIPEIKASETSKTSPEVSTRSRSIKPKATTSILKTDISLKTTKSTVSTRSRSQTPKTKTKKPEPVGKARAKSQPPRAAKKAAASKAKKLTNETRPTKKLKAELKAASKVNLTSTTPSSAKAVKSPKTTKKPAKRKGMDSDEVSYGSHNSSDFHSAS